MATNHISTMLSMKEAARAVKMRYEWMTYPNFRRYVITGRVPIAVVKEGRRLFDPDEIAKWKPVKYKTGKKTGGIDAGKSEGHL